jgi:hypothetical protein
VFDTSSAIFEWIPEEGKHNFGDHLMQLIGERIYTENEWSRIKRDENNKHVFIGSFIQDHNIRKALAECKRVHLVGCGYRGEPVSSEFGNRVSYIGCRGLHTAEKLAESGTVVPPIGDTAMVLPLLVGRGKSAQGETIFMPHINDENRRNYSPEKIGCNVIIQPTTQNTSDLIDLIKKISSSRFVLAGAMHAAIVAHAYGVPFAFYQEQGGYLDCPSKWTDWLSSVSKPVIEPCFVSNVRDGYVWWQSIQSQLFQNQFVPIVSAFSVLGRVRPDVKLNASVLDSIGLRPSYQLAPYQAYFKSKIKSNKALLPADSDDAYRECDFNKWEDDHRHGLFASVRELKTLTERSLSTRDRLIHEQRQQIAKFREELIRAEAQLDLLKDIMLGDRDDDCL